MRRDFRHLDLMEVLQEANPFMSFGPGASPNSIDEAVREERERGISVGVQSETLEEKVRLEGNRRRVGLGFVLIE